GATGNPYQRKRLCRGAGTTYHDSSDAALRSAEEYQAVAGRRADRLVASLGVLHMEVGGANDAVPTRRGLLHEGAPCLHGLLEYRGRCACIPVRADWSY